MSKRCLDDSWDAGWEEACDDGHALAETLYLDPVMIGMWDARYSEKVPERRRWDKSVWEEPAK